MSATAETAAACASKVKSSRSGESEHTTTCGAAKAVAVSSEPGWPERAVRWLAATAREREEHVPVRGAGACVAGMRPRSSPPPPAPPS